jgi:hypothetical protein
MNSQRYSCGRGGHRNSTLRRFAQQLR